MIFGTNERKKERSVFLTGIDMLCWRKPSGKTTKLNRQEICLISRIRSGHTRCAEDLKRMNIVESEGFPECNAPLQNLNHIFSTVQLIKILCSA